MADNPSSTGVAGDFCARLFGMAEGNVFVCALANEKGASRERFVATRDRDDIARFLVKHDRPGFAIYLCTGTLRPDAAPVRPGGSIRHKGSVAQIVTLIGDVDLKGCTLDRAGILAALRRLEIPPSVIVWSGRGAQVYWLLNEPLDATPETVALVERLNAQIADAIGGDPVHDVCRLLRLPGSHNTKDGAWLDVEVVEARWEPRHEIDDLEEWLSRQSPVIQRREKPTRSPSPAVGGGVRNVFERVAAEFGWRPPLDVEERLAAMSYQGSGDASIHNTQLAVSASLLNRGEAVEDVVDLVLQATREAAGVDGRAWNWEREERAIRGMCADWQRKHPDAPPRPAPRLVHEEPARAQARSAGADDVLREGSTGAQVHDLKRERAKREKTERRERAADGKTPTHLVLAEAVLAAMAERGEAVLFTEFGAYAFRDGIWTLHLSSEAQWLDVQIETACRALRIDGTNRIRSEARGAIRSNPELWRDRVEWDAHGMVPTRSGLVHPVTGALEPTRPDHYCTWRVEAEYDPAAGCPLWLEMAGDTFGDRPPAIRDEHLLCLQEVFGAALIDVKARGLSKALCLVGGPNCGKSGLLEVGSGMFGDDPITVDIESTAGTHGTMPFVRRAPWVLHEAFAQGKWLVSSTVKAMITGEPVSINVKNKPIVSRRIRAPIFWATNHPPQFKEATRAIVSRMIILNCKRRFEEAALVGVGARAAQLGLDRPSTLVLRDERPGVLNWMLSGLRRALARGAIEMPVEARETADEIHRDSNLAAGFVEWCVEFDPERRVSVPDFCAAFSVWFAENKGEDRHIPSNESVSKAVNALADSRIASHVKETRDNARRYFCGIALNHAGRAYWERALEGRMFEGKTASTTSATGEVNSYIPDSWESRPSIRQMRAFQARAKGGDGSYREMGGGTVTVTDAPVTGKASPQPSQEYASPTQRIDPSSESEF